MDLSSKYLTEIEFGFPLNRSFPMKCKVISFSARAESNQLQLLQRENVVPITRVGLDTEPQLGCCSNWAIMETVYGKEIGLISFINSNIRNLVGGEQKIKKSRMVVLRHRKLSKGGNAGSLEHSAPKVFQNSALVIVLLKWQYKTKTNANQSIQLDLKLSKLFLNTKKGNNSDYEISVLMQTLGEGQKER